MDASGPEAVSLLSVAHHEAAAVRLPTLVADITFLWCIRAMSGIPAYSAFQQDVCVYYGWCGGLVDGKPSHVDGFIPEDGPVSAEHFIEWLFLAEGLRPTLSVPTRPAAFQRAFFH